MYNCLKLKNLQDPVAEFGYPGVDAGLVFFGTANAPADDAGEHETAVFPLDHHWTTAVALKIVNITQPPYTTI